VSNFVVAPPGRPYKADFNVCIDSDGLPVPLRFAHQIVEVAATKVLILRRVQWRTARGTDGGLVLKLGPNYDQSQITLRPRALNSNIKMN